MSRLKMIEIAVADEQGPLCTVRLLGGGAYEVVLVERTFTSEEWASMSSQIHALLLELDEDAQ